VAQAGARGGWRVSAGGTRRRASEGHLERVEVVRAVEPSVGNLGRSGLVPVGADHGPGWVLSHDRDGLIGGSPKDAALSVKGNLSVKPRWITSQNP
jgi:hypothetical protein